jgi:hypothetical protein
MIRQRDVRLWKSGDRRDVHRNLGTGNLGTSMISKSQEETEVSWRLEE